jgi:hypothetical protein
MVTAIMTAASASAFRTELRRLLFDDALSPRDALLALVRCIDLATDAAVQADDADVELLIQRVLAHAAVALAPFLIPAGGHPRIEATALAAATFVASPSEAHWDAYLAAATSSYPFGPGDGCLAVDELGGHGAPGAGDHGAGFIWGVAVQVGVDRARRVLRAEMEAPIGDAEP